MAAKDGNGNGTTRIWWVITGIIMFLMTTTVATVGYAMRDIDIGSRNTTRIEGIQASLDRIDTKLERLLERE